jgi:hypothetical protein
MYVVKANIEEVCSELPKVSKWLRSIHKKILKTDIDMSIIDVFFAYGFFVPKGDKENYYDTQYTLKFEERLVLEMSKLRVDITLNIGKFSMTHRLDSNMVPTSIKQLVNELTKIKMLVEGRFHENQDVIDSIPEVDTSIISYRIVDNENDEIEESSNKFDIDLILDKITKDGIQSLSEEEKEFLDKVSKGF